MPFAVELTSFDAELSHYVTARVDIDGGGTVDCADYGNQDFNKFESPDEEQEVVVIPMRCQN